MRLWKHEGDSSETCPLYQNQQQVPLASLIFQLSSCKFSKANGSVCGGSGEMVNGQPQVAPLLSGGGEKRDFQQVSHGVYMHCS